MLLSALRASRRWARVLPKATSGTAEPLAALRRAWPRQMAAVVTFPLAQTGEGIAECELVRWDVQVRTVPAAPCGTLRRLRDCSR